jgi:2-polyprenyl-3-methyl-5-hydroxy-6-metoxy-1,4-benzoquinol methylase
MHLAERFGCRVHGITLSREQLALATERIAARGLSHLITLEIIDYRELARTRPGSFDKILSVEMVEAVGSNYLSAYMGALDSLLAPNGIVVLQVRAPLPVHLAACLARSYLAASDSVACRPSRSPSTDGPSMSAQPTSSTP